MSRQTILSALLALAAQTTAQQVGTNQAEVHPPLPYQKCTASGCTTVDTSVVIDANWRWVHNVTGYTNCYTGNTWNKALCPDPTTCAKTCALDGAAYGSTYGISTSGNALTLDLVTGSNIGSRNYLLNAAGTKYEMFMLKGMEFTFDVDVSNLPCGLNGALYFVAMDADGGLAKYPTNKAGAAYGTGYCDAQCPQDLKFIDGLANVVNWTPSSSDVNSGTGSAGSCCTEMDIWEANSISQALTPHDCSVTGQTACNSTTTCGTGAANRYTGLCDKDGCDFNPYRWGNHTFYGPGETVNTNSKFTVVTQFITNDGTTTGTLTAIKRLYVQNGKVINQSNTNVAGITTTNQITDTFCNQQKTVTGDTNEFEKLGGLANMGKAMANGMVLVLSIWDDYAANMLWLDSDYPTASPATAPGVARGTCPTTSGNPATVNSQSPNSHVIYSNIKLGTIGSTYAH